MIKFTKHTPLQIIDYIYKYSAGPIELDCDITIIHHFTEIDRKQNVIFKSNLYESMVTKQITSTLNSMTIDSYDFFLYLYQYTYLMLVYKENIVYVGYTQVDIHGILPAILVPYKQNDVKTLNIFLNYINKEKRVQERLKYAIKQSINILYDYFKMNKLLIDLDR